MDERRIFEARGLVRCERFLPADLVGRARDVVFEPLREAGVRRDGGWHYDAIAHVPWHQRNKVLVQSVRKSRAFRDLITPELLHLIDGVAGVEDGSLSPMVPRPQLLFSVPNAESWSVPHNVWHVDLPALPNRGCPGVQIFTFLAPVVPGGGGTVVVAGSHRFTEDLEWLGSKQIKKRLKAETYFRELMSKKTPGRERFLEPIRAGDVEVQVVELSGEPGDVYVMDLRLLHAPAPNVSPAPRIMLTQRFLVAQMHDELHRLYAAPARTPVGAGTRESRGA